MFRSFRVGVNRTGMLAGFFIELISSFLFIYTLGVRPSEPNWLDESDWLEDIKLGKIINI